MSGLIVVQEQVGGRYGARDEAESSHALGIDPSATTPGTDAWTTRPCPRLESSHALGIDPSATAPGTDA